MKAKSMAVEMESSLMTLHACFENRKELQVMFLTVPNNKTPAVVTRVLCVIFKSLIGDNPQKLLDTLSIEMDWSLV